MKRESKKLWLDLAEKFARWVEDWLWETVNPKRVPFTYRLGGGWGDRIEWWKIGTKIVGWKEPLPQKGDVLLAPMASGKTGRFVMGKIEAQRDPRDMFFADVRFEGYEEEPRVVGVSHE